MGAPWSFGGVVGHFTQVVWGESYQIGCGFTFYYDETKPQNPYAKLYICNYGPGGNFANEPIYEKEEGKKKKKNKKKKKGGKKEKKERKKRKKKERRKNKPGQAADIINGIYI